MDATAELRKMVDELSKELEAEKKLAAKYHEQLLDTRDRMVRQDYDLENSKKDYENFNKVIRSLTKENQVLKDLVKANAMAQLEFL